MHGEVFHARSSNSVFCIPQSLSGKVNITNAVSLSTYLVKRSPMHSGDRVKPKILTVQRELIN